MGACREWTGQRSRDGYGRILIGGKDGRLQLVHRLSWQIHRGPIPPGLQVLHRCDNPPCWRVEHLFLGTHADNMADMAAKGRRRGAVGECNSHAKLTVADVRVIRERYEPRSRSTGRAALAGEYGVSVYTISKIVNGAIWAEV